MPASWHFSDVVEVICSCECLYVRDMSRRMHQHVIYAQAIRPLCQCIVSDQVHPIGVRAERIESVCNIVNYVSDSPGARYSNPLITFVEELSLYLRTAVLDIESIIRNAPSRVVAGDDIKIEIMCNAYLSVYETVIAPVLMLQTIRSNDADMTRVIYDEDRMRLNNISDLFTPRHADMQVISGTSNELPQETDVMPETDMMSVADISAMSNELPHANNVVPGTDIIPAAEISAVGSNNSEKCKPGVLVSIRTWRILAEMLSKCDHRMRLRGLEMFCLYLSRYIWHSYSRLIVTPRSICDDSVVLSDHDDDDDDGVGWTDMIDDAILLYEVMSSLRDNILNARAESSVGAESWHSDSDVFTPYVEPLVQHTRYGKHGHVIVLPLIVASAIMLYGNEDMPCVRSAVTDIETFVRGNTPRVLGISRTYALFLLLYIFVLLIYCA